MEMFTCSKCAQQKPVLHNGGTGYASDRENEAIKTCYECCAVVDREAMARGEIIPLYFDASRKQVANWPGTLIFHIVRTSIGKRHNVTGARRLDFWFYGPDGHIWHGVKVSDNQDIVTCRPTKKKAA